MAKTYRYIFGRGPVYAVPDEPKTLIELENTTAEGRFNPPLVLVPALERPLDSPKVPRLEDKDVFSREETALILGVSEPTVDRYIDLGLLTARKARRTGRVLISSASIQAFLKRRNGVKE